MPAVINKTTILSGRSTINSSTAEARKPCEPIAAKTASPHTLPVEPPQKIIFNGVEIQIAVKPASKPVRRMPGALLTHAHTKPSNQPQCQFQLA